LGCVSAAIMVSCASAQSAKASGAALFQQKGCSHCHTIAGTGGTKGPDLSDVGSRLTVPRMEHQMLAGGLNMPPFRDALTLKEVRQLAGFLATCRSSQSTAVAERSPSADPEKSFQ
jgi:ubiquinol-cytochrome c reductase cytochrome b subunit